MEEGRQEARGKKIEEYLGKTRRLHKEHNYQDALIEVMKIFIIDPQHPAAKELEESIRQEQKQEWENEINNAMTTKRQATLDTYQRALRKAWSDGPLSPNEESILTNLRQSLNITSEEHSTIEPVAKREAYLDALKETLSSGTPTKKTIDFLVMLRKECNVSEEEHRQFEQELLSSKK